MKRLLILVGWIAAIATHAQGTIDMQNKNTAVGLDVYFQLADSHVCYDPLGGDQKLGSTFAAGLYVRQPNGEFAPAVLLSNGVPTTVSFITSAASGPNGYFSARNLVVQGTEPDSTIEVKIAAWPKAYGATYEEVVHTMMAQGNPWRGLTDSFSVTLGGGGSPVKAPGVLTNLEIVATDVGHTFFTVRNDGECYEPQIRTQPVGVTAYPGVTVSFTVTARCWWPWSFSYAWSFQGVPIPGQTAASLTLTNITADQAGDYTVTVSNEYGGETSNPATLVVQVPVQSVLLEPLWSLGPGSRPYLAEDNAQRGLAYNKATGNLLLVSRTAGNQVIVLEGATGAYKHQLNMLLADGSAISGGTLAVNMIGVTDDGVVYVGNHTSDGHASPFRLYRWEKDAPEAVPSLITGFVRLDSAGRCCWGDSLDVRGTSPNEQIALGARDHNTFAILDGLAPGTGSARVFDVAGASPGNFGRGIAFGQGDTVWATASGQPLIQASFDLDGGSAALLHSYDGTVVPVSMSVVGVHPTSELLFGIAFETPDNVQAYDISDMEGGPVLVDQELIFADRLNGNFTGAIDAQGDKVFALDTNNGIHAYKLNPLPPSLSVIRIGGSNLVIRMRGGRGVIYLIQSSPALTGDWTTLFERQCSGTPIEIEIPMAGEPMKFIRATAK